MAAPVDTHTLQWKEGLEIRVFRWRCGSAEVLRCFVSAVRAAGTAVLCGASPRGPALAQGATQAPPPPLCARGPSALLPAGGEVAPSAPRSRFWSLIRRAWSTSHGAMAALCTFTRFQCPMCNSRGEISRSLFAHTSILNTTSTKLQLPSAHMGVKAAAYHTTRAAPQNRRSSVLPPVRD
jgi:predicted RNA-binding Zn-ribbon protein involved in translation (DUF1610 family)